MSRLATPMTFGILFFCGAITALAGVERLPADARDGLERTSNFRSISSVSGIPESVRVAFARAVGDASFAMAEPGAKWQATDVVLESGLPWRRLQAGAVSNDFVVLFYEHGGIGHSYHVCVFRASDDSAKLVWHAIHPKHVVNLDDLNRAIRSGVADDDPKYVF